MRRYVELPSLVGAPPRVARLPEGRVRHQQHHPRFRLERPLDRCDDLLERVHVLDREQERGGVVSRRLESGHRSQTARVADEEARLAQSAVASFRRGDQLRRRVHHGHSRSSIDESRSEHPLPATDVENRLARPWLKQVHDRRNRQLAVIGRPAVTDPAVVPGRHALPARLASLARDWLSSSRHAVTRTIRDSRTPAARAPGRSHHPTGLGHRAVPRA